MVEMLSHLKHTFFILAKLVLMEYFKAIYTVMVLKMKL